ncbi:MAG TPA: glycosyltransferase [Acidimicrobiales bacterium]|nr:glycosyltransferase [Acidimicrobiales bacterium]
MSAGPRSMATGTVVLDLQATQSPDHRGRGIARWALEFTLALAKDHQGVLAGIVLNPDLPPPDGIEPLLSTGLLSYGFGSVGSRARIWHCLSPFELTLPLGAVWPREAHERGLVFAATSYDLIPLELAEHYLHLPERKRRYLTRLRALQVADHLLAISDTAADQLVTLAGIERERISVIGTGVSPRFSEAAGNRTQAPRVPGVEETFILYPGGTDHRKNVEGLIRGYAQLPEELRRFQLVVTCDMPPIPLRHFEHVARTTGVGDRVLFAGHVADDDLLALYRRAQLVVFPSLAEGFGLPVAEALATGAPVIASDIAAFAELVPADQRFEPTAEGIGAALTRALRDETWRAEIASRPVPARDWADVASRAAAVYAELQVRPLRKVSRLAERPSVAFVTPLPPAPTGISHHSYRLAEALAATGEVDLDLFADGLDREHYVPAAPGGLPTFSASSLHAVEALRGGYDHVVYALGNSDNHVGALRLLRERPGVVLGHDVRLTNLYKFGAADPLAVPGGYDAAVDSMYGSGGDYLMAREAIGLSEGYLVSSGAAAAMAEIDAGPDTAAGKISVLPFAAAAAESGRGGFDELAGPDDTEELPPEDELPLVVSFGIVHPIRQPARLIEAFATVTTPAHLAFVGPVPEALEAELAEQAAALGVDVVFTGQLGTEAFLAWMSRATLAVQLRGSWNGEASGSIGECITVGVPLVVSDIGWARELGDVVVRVPAEASPAELGATIDELLADPGRRQQLIDAELDFAPSLSFDRAARNLLDYLFGRRSTNLTAERSAGRS